MLRRWFHRWVLSRRWACFVALGLGFLVFGTGTLNLFFMLEASITLVITHGWLALMEGAALQLLELTLTAYVSMAAYVLFKTCEHQLVHDLASAPSAPHPAAKGRPQGNHDEDCDPAG